MLCAASGLVFTLIPGLTPDVAHSATSAEDSKNITKVLPQLSIPWGMAPLTKNTDHLKRICADDFSYIMSDGTVYNKKAFPAVCENDTNTYTSAANTAFKVRVYVKNFAHTVGDDHYVGKDKYGKPFSNKGRFTNVWVRQNGTWQVVAVPTCMKCGQATSTVRQCGRLLIGPAVRGTELAYRSRISRTIVPSPPAPLSPTRYSRKPGDVSCVDQVVGVSRRH